MYGAVGVVLFLVVLIALSLRPSSSLSVYTHRIIGHRDPAFVGVTSDSRKLPPESALEPPEYTVDESTGLSYPPDIYPAALNIYQRANAAMVALVRNSELREMQDSMRDVEYRFNRKFSYPWIFMNEEPFTDEFKAGVSKMTRGECIFALIPEEHWSYPATINQTLAAENRQKMVDQDVIYGGSESYRHMCRFNSGFFFKQEAILPYDYYWRVEPGISLYCDIDYDAFLMMQVNKKIYAFTISLYEYEATIPSLWATVRKFAAKFPHHIADKNSLAFLVDDKTVGFEDSKYNGCHFWSNFEIADLNFWRSQAYQDFFEFLDETGGFFYERWGDAPVHSIAVALLAPAAQLHQFDDVGYSHSPFLHCPSNPLYQSSGKCDCNPEDSFDRDGYSCLSRWWAIADELDLKGARRPA